MMNRQREDVTEVPDQGHSWTCAGCGEEWPEDLATGRVCAKCALRGALRSADSEASLPTRTRLGTYAIVRELGRGAKSVVYLARKDDSARLVAMKVVRTGADSEDVLRRFDEERSVLEILDSDQTSRIYEASAAEDGSPYFVMEYVDGVPITSYCDERRLNLGGRLALFAEVCEAVHSAHQKGVIHRDLKPSNILVAQAAGKAKAKIIDFGLSRLLPEAGIVRADLTLPDQILGTPGYLSPEQAVPRTGPPDVRSDVYSLGAVLYELLTGEPPHDLDILAREGLEAMIRHIRLSDPVRPSVRVVSLPTDSGIPRERGVPGPRALAARLRGELDWIVVKAIEKEPSRRYASVHDLELDIRRFLLHQPIDAAPPGASYLVRKFVRRHRVGVGASVLSVISLMAFGGAMAVQARRISRERNRAESVSRFLTDLFSASDPDKALGQSATAREILDKGTERIEHELRNEPQVQAQLFATIGRVYSNLGDYPKAEQVLGLSIQCWKQALGSEAQGTLAAKFALARLYQLEGRLREAEALHRDALDSQRRILGNEHRDTLLSISSLANAINTQGRFHEAELLYREVLAEQRRVLGSDDPQTVASLSNLGNALGAQGRIKDGEAAYREALEAERRLLGDDHPHTLITMNNVADCCRARGEFDEAERLHEGVLRRRTKVLGPNHPDTVFSIYSLAQVAASRGQRDKAIEWLKEAVARGLSIADEMSSDPTLAALHGDAAFDAVVAAARENASKSQRKPSEP
jgi:non-specific serine/threonine protein kinase/serine/threonine-protein kinase